MDRSGVDYLWIIVMFLSAVWTLILTAPIHCRGSIAEQVMYAKFLQICSNEESNSSKSRLAWGQYIFSKFLFWVNYSLIVNIPVLLHWPVDWELHAIFVH